MSHQCPVCKRVVPYELAHYMGMSEYACKWPGDEHKLNPTRPKA